MGRLLNRIILGICLLAPVSASASTLQLTQRKVQVSGTLNVASATKVSNSLISIAAQADAPIYMVVTATGGTAQGVMLIADTIRSLKSPVVAVVTTQVHGAGAAVATFADKVVVYRSAGFAFTEVEYEGVKKYEPPRPSPAAKKGEEKDAKDAKPAKPAPSAKERSATEKFLQDVVRSQYLARFQEALARRIHWKPKKLKSTLADAGGLFLTPEQAVEQRVADEVIEKISYAKLPEVKREVKVTTTDQVTTTSPKSQ